MIGEVFGLLLEIVIRGLAKVDDDGKGRRPSLVAIVLIPVALAGFGYLFWQLLPDHPWIVLGLILVTLAIVLLLWLGRRRPRRRRRYRGHMPGTRPSES